MNRRLVAMMAAVAVIVPMAACVSPSETQSTVPAAEAVTLSVWQGNATETEVQQGIDQFTKTHPNYKFAMTNILDQGTYLTKLGLAINSNEVPDLFETWGANSAYSQYLPDQLTDLGAELPDLLTKYLPSVLTPLDYEGKFYGIPYKGAEPDLFYYNKKVFSDAGIAGPPETWEELVEDIKILKEHGVIPLAQGSEDWTLMTWPMVIAIQLGGPDFLDKILNNEPNAWSDPVMTEALRLTKEVIDLDPFQPGYEAIPWQNGVPTELVASGQAAMELQGAWEYSHFQNVAPDFAESEDFGFFAVPKVPGAAEPTAVTGNPGTYMAIPAKAPNKESALEFANYLLSDEYAEILLRRGQVPATVTGGDLISSVEPALPKVTEEFNTFVYSMVENATSFGVSWNQGLSPSVSAAMLSNMTQFFAGTMTAQEFQNDLNNIAGTVS